MNQVYLLIVTRRINGIRRQWVAGDIRLNFSGQWSWRYYFYEKVDSGYTDTKKQAFLKVNECVLKYEKM